MGQLGLTPGEKNDVKAFAGQYDSESAMRKALTLWYNRNPLQATYKALVKIALTLGEGQTAINICMYLKSKCRQQVHTKCTQTKNVHKYTSVLLCMHIYTYTYSL